jgi:UDP-2-acetamido-2-deoxy-ribo-hexuluronate aminotransferase
MEFIDLKTQYRLLRKSIDQRIQDVLDHGQYIMGPEVSELEDQLCAFTGAKNCITMASGTEALLASLMALDIQPGDEIITTSFSFVATAEVIVRLGATPVFVDIEEDTCNINAALIESSITARTRAIIPVSLYGQPADMDEINAIADKYGLVVIEDAAQSFGASYKGKKSCNLSTIGCTSFFPSKPLGCYGDGGAIFTNDDNLAESFRKIRLHGQTARYLHTCVGLGGRMDTLQCAIVLAKLERFELEVALRGKVGDNYNTILNGKIQVVQQMLDRTSVFAQFTVFVENREQIRQLLDRENIPSAVHYPLAIHQQKPYLKFSADAHLPVSCRAATRVLSLPMHPELTEFEQQRVANALIAISLECRKTNEKNATHSPRMTS